jgi:hypothetical protein
VHARARVRSLRVIVPHAGRARARVRVCVCLSVCLSGWLAGLAGWLSGWLSVCLAWRGGTARGATAVDAHALMELLCARLGHEAVAVKLKTLNLAMQLAREGNAVVRRPLRPFRRPFCLRLIYVTSVLVTKY